MQRYVSVRFFHEIALKGLNRPLFSRRLHSNLKEALRGTEARVLRREPMMALLSDPGEGRWPLLKERLETVVGVERFARVYQVAPSIEAVEEAVGKLVEGGQARSFRITASRSDKSFPLTSPQLNQRLGTLVQRLTGMPVDLGNPALNLRVHVQRQGALLSLEEFSGLGGMPVGVGGRVAALLSGGIDSPVAAFQVMRRGCQVLFVHFHSFPFVEGSSREKARELVQHLTRYQFRSRLILVPFASVQQQILVAAPPDYRVVLYRRFMMRIAEKLAIQERAQALVTGESIGQVSSQTLENLVTIDAAAERLPVLRPLVSFDKEEIIGRAKRLGTYPISILPDQDCCSLFVPPHPVTRSSPEEALRLEAGLDVAGLVREAAVKVEVFDYAWPEGTEEPLKAMPSD
ncbi:MAG: tRNA 4-thiouridine(8) synthase ThiI [Chloroflexi bacterium]|nr:tRNA 4-thiouridine(8) synthase ThiI [Chloroflexota bacterium]